jgi:hypothetical protein
MKTTSMLTGLIFGIVLLTSCDKETVNVSGEVTRVQVNLTGFTGLKVASSFSAFVTFSDTEEKIIVEANEDIQNLVVVEIKDNNLEIKLKKQTNIRGNATMNVYITTKNINYYLATGASRITLESELIAESAKIDLSGASIFSGQLNTDNLELEAEGASQIDIFGKTGEFKAELSGGSGLLNYDFLVKNLTIALSGASNAQLAVSESIKIDAAGASSLTYEGAALVTEKHLTGASQLIKKD